MPALLQIHDVTYSRGSKLLFENISLTINPGDRIGLVGHNGSGKSSLLSLIVGDNSPDQGEIRFPRGQRLALVEQFVPASLFDTTLQQALLDALPIESQIDQRYRVDTLLQQLHFQPELWPLAIKSLSGGEQNLALLARALLSEPDLLLMDEPGNHMDVIALSRLQNFLTKEYQQPFLMISHDRELLDACCKRTVFLRDQNLYSFELPYEAASRALAAQDEQALRSRKAEEKEINRVQASAKRLARWGKDFDNEDFARKAKSMQKRVDRLVSEKTFVSSGSHLDLQLQIDTIRAKSALTLENLKVVTPDGQRHLMSCEFQRVKPGDRIALLGKNGIGKSTTLNLLLDAYTSFNDAIRFNPNTNLGFYDQELQQFTTRQGRFDWLRDRIDGPDSRIKKVLLQAGVSYVDFDRPVNTLSGGECARLMFMLFRLTRPNFLILDEPTNHIDIEGREQLEQQLIDAGATLLITSHDRRFVERIANRWWWISNETLEELHDLESFYSSVTSGQQTSISASAHVESGRAQAVEPGMSADKMLERIETLERLLTQDKARKLKFQKPDRQRQWQNEIDQLWASVETGVNPD